MTMYRITVSSNGGIMQEMMQEWGSGRQEQVVVPRVG
jgi:hypothetical protein